MRRIHFFIKTLCRSYVKKNSSQASWSDNGVANYSPKTLPFSNQCFPLVLFHRTHLMSKTITGFTEIFSERVEFIFLTGPKGHYRSSTKRCFPRRILQRKSKMLSALKGRLFVWSSINMAPWKPYSAKQHKVCYKGTKKARVQGAVIAS